MHEVRVALETFKTWKEVPAPKRGEVIRQLGNKLREKKEELAQIITSEVGKIYQESLGEVQEMIDICDFAVGLSRQLYGLTIASERYRHKMTEQWHPLGVIGVITAFNFPGAVWAWNAAIATVCGNTIVWKPSELAKETAKYIHAICEEVSKDNDCDGVFNLIKGDGRLGHQLARDKRIPLISFTGSTKVGRNVFEVVARRLGKCLLELGGNNAVIVAEDADLDLATRAILFGAVGTNGQRCTTTRRLIAHKDISKELTQRLLRAYEQIVVDDPLSEKALMGPLINRKAVEKFELALKVSELEGGEILCGGKIRDRYVKPAIVKMPSQSDIVRDETFAPILYVMEYETLEEAIEINNDVSQGLSSSIFTDSLCKAEQFLSAVGSDCGIANVNIGTSGAEIGGAFGGEKDTGGGRESGSDSWKAYMRRQTNTTNWSNELPLAQGIKFGD
jgi:aldehyde dehydrogenase (NAD+)